MFLSIIIPVYKVEEYLEQCLDSVLKQSSFAVFEVIAVNDGSPDGSKEILDRYARQYPNLKVIHQQNQGLSVARNTGLEIANGKYVWFIDSDDWIESGVLMDIENTLCKDPDILEIGFNFVWSDRTIFNRQYFWAGLISGCDAYLRNGIPAPAQFTIVKRSLLIENNLKFYPGILHEDTEYKPKLAIVARTAACLDKPVYNYRQRESGNIMSTYCFRNAHDLVTGCRSIVDFILTRPYNEQEYNVIGDAIGANINHLLHRLAHYNGPDYKRIIELLKDNKDLFRWLKKSAKRRYRIESFLFRLCFGVALSLVIFSQLYK